MSNKNKEMLKKCRKILITDKVAEWYTENLEGDKQENTIETLLKGIEKGKITIIQALYLAWLVGFQWNEKFNCP
jgi:hypothetical protein